MLSDWGLIGLFLIAVILFVTSMATTPLLLTKLGVIPHKPNKIKNATYECAAHTVGPSRFRFNIRYYHYALLFVTLDVVAVFLFPWSVVLANLDGVGEFAGDALFALVGMAVFVAIIGIGYLYAWKKRLLEWR